MQQKRLKPKVEKPELSDKKLVKGCQKFKENENETTIFHWRTPQQQEDLYDDMLDIDLTEHGDF